MEMSTLPIPDKVRARAACARGLDRARLPDQRHRGAAQGPRLDDLHERRAARLRRVRPVLGVFTDDIPYVGDFGAGMRMKLIANHLVAILNVATGEAMTFARSMGLDARRVWELFGSNPAVGNGVLRLRGKLMVERRYRPATMKVEVWQKDMRIIGDMARSSGRADTALQRLRSGLRRRDGAGLRQRGHRVGLRCSRAAGAATE